MINQLLYIDGQLVDLYDNGGRKFIAQSINGLTAGDIKTRDANTTNRISLPPTENNKQILGLNDERSEEITPYRVKTARYIQGGVEKISNGTAVVFGFNGIDYEISILSGVYDLFKQIENLNVDDMDFGVYEVIDDAYLETIRESTNLFSAPVIDFGTLFPPIQIVGNDNFFNDMSPWGNEERAYPLEVLGTAGDPWEVYNNNENISYLSTSSNLQKSKRLQQVYKIFKGFTYRIQLTVLPHDEEDGLYDQIRVDIRTLDNLTFLTICEENDLPTDVEFTLDETFTASRDYEFVEITARSGVSTPGVQNKATLKRIKITDISGLTDIYAVYYMPVISYSKVIERIINNAGYQVSLNMLNQTYYERLFISFSKSKYEYPERLINKMPFSYTAAAQHIELNEVTPVYHNIEFPIENILGEYAWYNGLDTYSVPSVGYSIEVVVKANILVEVLLSGVGEIGFFFRLDGSTQTQTEAITTSQTTVLTFESNAVECGLSTKTFDLACKRMSGAATYVVNVISGTFWVEVSKRAFNTINLSALVLPTVKQSDFLADFLIRFNVLHDVENNVVYLTELEKAVKDKSVKDWTLKRDASIKRAIGYDLEYAQENIFTDIIPDTPIILHGNALVTIDNDTLDLSTEYYKSIMSAIQEHLNNGFLICRVPYFDRTQPGGIGDYDSNPRLFYLREEMDSDTAVMYNGVTKTTYLVGVYSDPLVPYKTTWQYFLTNYYPSFERALQKNKVVTSYYLLTDIDVANLRTYDLIFDNGVYYAIVKVKDFISGQKTQVYLFKLI